MMSETPQERATGAPPRPRIVGEVDRLAADHHRSGSVWKLTPPQRGLDANIIALAPHDGIDSHLGPAIDVLIHVLQGAGTLMTDEDEIELRPGVLVWLPARSRRRFLAGDEGLQYFSVHQRKQGLSIGRRPPDSEPERR